MHLIDILRSYPVDLSHFSFPEYQRAGEKRLIYLLQTSATQVLSQWELLRSLVPETGYWPVVGWDRFKKPLWEEKPVQNIVEAGSHLNISQWFKEQWLQQNGASILNREEKDILNDVKAPSSFAFRLHYRRFANTCPPLVPITLIPTTDFWEVPAYLPVQANEWDPPDVVHIAAMKYWNDQWKAELVSMVSGSLEMRVLQPPTTLYEALALAKEQYLYAPDLVDQLLGGNINTLARMLLNSYVWYFWWD
jgi:uncharacterized protein DUF4253